MLGDRTGKGSSVAASSLFSFVPRAVMLECSAVGREVTAAPSENTKKRKKEKKNAAIVTAALVRAISSFLESNGFTKTLAALRSEAQPEIGDGGEASALDLKEIMRKYLELSDDSAVEKTENKGEKVKENEKLVHDPLEKPISKKKKKDSKKSGDQSENRAVSQSQVTETPPERKPETDESPLLEKCEKNPKNQKKKSEASEVQVLVEERVKDVVVLPENTHKLSQESNDRSEDKNKSDKKKKKKKGEEEKKKDASPHSIGEDKSNKKKRKHRLTEISVEHEYEMQNGNNTESKKNGEDSENDLGKKRKILPSQELEIQVDNTENLEKKELESNGSSKSAKSEKKLSMTQKAANAFQRVKVEAVEFVDERLQDNSYWAKDGAESGYGAKAQEVLGQVRGRDFRHEKTKKKRGSYRGGQIDFQSHSVKFQYSDEDE